MSWECCLPPSKVFRSWSLRVGCGELPAADEYVNAITRSMIKNCHRLLLSLSFVAMRKLRGTCQLGAIVGDNVTVLLSLIQYNFLIVVIDLLYITSVLPIIKDKKTIHLNKCKRWVDLFISFVSQVISNLIWTMLNLHLLSWHSRSKFELILCNISWIVYLLNLNK